MSKNMGRSEQSEPHTSTVVDHRLWKPAEQAGVHQEKLKQAEARISELEHVNDAFRRGTERIAAARSIDAILDSFLLETMYLSGAPSGAIADRIAGTEFVLRSLAQDGVSTNINAWSLDSRFRQLTARDPEGVLSRVISGEAFSLTVDEIALWFPEVASYYRARGQRLIWFFPFSAGGAVTGCLVLGFAENWPLCEFKCGTVQALAQQASLALQVVRLAEEAKQGAIASERERAADHRSCELAKINAALRDATDRLATETQLGSFYGHLVQEAARLLGASSAHLTLVDEAANSLRTLAYLKRGVLSVPDYPIQLPISQVSRVLNQFCQSRDLEYLDLERDPELFSDGAVEFHRASGHRALAAVPLVWSNRCIGYIGLAWVEEPRLDSAQHELLKALAQHATLAVHLTRLADQVRRGAILEERVALARELHDTLLQGFTGITLQLRALLKSTPKEPGQVHHALEAIEAEATRSVREARRAVGDIRGNEPGAADLVTALQELVQSESMRTTAHLCWKLEGEPRELPANVAESVFRIGREALGNAVRHADASCIEVWLLLRPRSLRLSVTDNGKGFHLSSEMARRQGHWGLIGMEERAAHLGGECKIVSQAGRGTTISVEIPV